MTESTQLKYENIRKSFHANPELSGMEYNTQAKITAHLETIPNIQIQKIAETGVLATFKGNEDGATVLIRADIDALPIQEVNGFEHRSKSDGVSHKCGHDGHLTIVLALADHLSKSPITKGRIMLLFQPSEENGMGAERVLNDDHFKSLHIDWVFALHNLPGFDLNTIVVKNGAFTAEVKSMAIRLEGFTAHAAEPEKGRSPSKAIAALLSYAEKQTNSDRTSANFFQITPVHSILGEKAYGVAPGHGEVHFTLRAWSPDIMHSNCLELETYLKGLCEIEELTFELSYLEAFSANTNDKLAVEVVRSAAILSELKVKEMTQPFRWGEDFGLFTQGYRGAMFGIGAGVECPPLHHPSYDFPDTLIPAARKIFSSIIDDLLK